MRKIYANLLLVSSMLLAGLLAEAQLTGTKTIPGDYATIAAAVTDLNTAGVGPGGVIFNVVAGHTEATATGIDITATGTAGNTILFQKSGVGANPKVTRTDAGANATSAFGGMGDGIIKMNGTDYITFDAIDLEATDQGIEYGYYTSKPSGTDGSQFLTIKNCVITMTKGTSAFVTGIHIGNGSTSLSSATGVTVSDASGSNANVLITGNTIRNVHAGIYVRGGSASAYYETGLVIGQSGQGNTIENFGGGSASTTYGVYMIYQSGPVVSYNTIDNAGGGGSSHNSTLYGIMYSTGSGDVVGSNNTITLSNSSTSSATYGIYSGTTVASENFSSNSFGDWNLSSTGSVYLIYASSATAGAKTITNNTITGTINRTGASGSVYGYYNNGSPTSGTETISGNNFSNISLAGTSSFYGINSTTASGHSQLIFGNTISNVSGGSGTRYGINVGFANTRNVYGNNIFNIAGDGTVYGIGNGSGGATELNIHGNKIYALSSTSTGTTSGLVTGILVSSGSSGAAANIFNNLVGDLTAPSAAGTDAIRGISSTSSTATTNVNIYYNSIYLEASSTGANFGTSGIFHTGSTTATTAALTLRNNLVINKSVPAGTGLTVAYRRSSTSSANFIAASNNNIYYAGTPGAANLIFSDGTNNFSALVDYKIFISSLGADQQSETENVPLQSTTGSSPDFLKFNTLVVNEAESGAENITGFTSDFAGNTRQGNPGYAGTGTKPDVGAWELEGTQPTCSGAPASSNTIASQNPGCQGQPLVLSLDQVYLAVTYQWQSSTDNLSYSDVVGETNETMVVSAPAVTTWYRARISCGPDNTLSTPVQVLIHPALAGNYTINNLNPTAGTNYNNFEDAIADLNCRGVSAPVVFNVAVGQVFPGTAQLEITATGTSVNTITFQKDGVGVNPKIQRTGTSATNEYVLRLTGSDYITFDGIDLEQSGTSSTDWVEYGLYVTNSSVTDGASYNSFKNGVISLTNTSSASKGVYLHTPTTPTAAEGNNNFNRFLNMTVQNSYEGYRINGATTTFPAEGNEIGTEGGGSSLVQNLGDGTATGSVYGIYATYQGNFKVRNTEIRNLLPGSTSLAYGIAMQTSSANSGEISNNHIHNITGGGTVTGINMTSVDTADIFNNHIHTLKTTTATSSDVAGIDVSGTGANVNIYNNRIYNISSDGLTGTVATGIDVATGLEYNIYNNMVSNISAPASTTTSGGTRGIAVTGGSTGAIARIYHNTVFLNDVAGVAAYTSAGILNSSSTPTLDIRNNIILNKSDISVTGTRVVAFWKTSSTDNVAPTSDNNLYYAGTPGTGNLIFYDGTNSAQTITAYNSLGSITPGETLSITENLTLQPIVTGILRPDATIPTLVESGGQALALVPSDFEADIRHASTPDLGADEGTFTMAVQPVPGCAGLEGPADGSNTVCSYQNVILRWTAPTTGGTVSGGYDVHFGTSPTPPLVTNVSALEYNATGLLPNTTYYWQIIPRNTTGSAVGCSVWSFTTINAEVLTTTPGSVCGTGTVALAATGSGTLNWYDVATGGTILGTGTNFVTPSISATTTYYVEAGSGLGTGTVGRSEADAGISGTTASTYGLVFDAHADLTIDSVTVILNTTSGGTLQLQLRDSLSGSTGPGTFIRASAAIPIPTGTIGTRVRIPIGFAVPAGQGYRLLAISSPSLVRTTSAGGYPYLSTNNAATITSGFITNSGSATYYYFYDWRITSGCQSPRVPVEATVIPASVGGTVSADQTICTNTAPADLVLSGHTGDVVKWQSATDAAFTTPTDISVTSATLSSGSIGPLALTTYFRAIVQSSTCDPDTSSFVTITVSSAPSATVSYAGSPYCSNSGLVAVTLTGSAGGVFSSSAGLTIDPVTGEVNATTSTPGTYTVNYDIAASGGCSAFSTTTSITITAAPSATIVYGGSPYCATLTSAIVTLTGTAGGNFTATPAGLTINATTGEVNPSTSTPGAYTVTYTIDTAAGCSTFTTTAAINITAAPAATISYAGSPYCSDGGTATPALTGTAGGTYSAAPAGLVIDPSTGAITLGTSTPGTYTVSYDIAASGGCAAFNTTASVTITAAPAATISYAGSPYCSGGGTASVTHTGTTGGTYSASPAGLTIDANTGEVTLGSSTPGTYTVTYTIAAAGGCGQFTTNASITVVTAPSATISYAGSPYCSNAGTASPAFSGSTGGTYSAAPAGLSINAATGDVDLGASTPGTYTVTYDLAASGGCPAFSTTAEIIITAAPSATISYTGSPYCQNGGVAAVTLTGTTGGTFTAAPAGLDIDPATGDITLASSAAGTYTVTYTIVAAGGCAMITATANLDVQTAPDATISYTGSPFCSASGTAPVVFSGTAGGTFSASPAGLAINAATGEIDLAASNGGTYTVTYTIAATGGCPVFNATTSVTISQTGTWIGITSSDWNTASNWCGGVPTSATDVVIPSAAPNMPEIFAASGEVRNLSISAGGSVTVGAGGRLDLYGNLVAAGTFDVSAGHLALRGTANQATPAITALDVTVNGAGWTPGGHSVISGSLVLTNGNITLGANNLTLHNSSTGSAASHIIVNGTGRVIVSAFAASSSRVVPVGTDATSYNPVWLVSNAGHTTDNFTVGVLNGVFVNGVSGTQFTTHVVDRTWLITEGTAGGSNVNVTVQWTANQELTGFNRTKSYVMQHNGTSWVPGTELPAGGNDPYSLTKPNVTSFSSFAVQTQPIPRPITGIYPNPTSGVLNVVVDLPAAEQVNITVHDAAGHLVMEREAALTQGLNLYTMNVAHLSSGVYFIKLSIRNNPEFLLTRFVKQ